MRTLRAVAIGFAVAIGLAAPAAPADPRPASAGADARAAVFEVIGAARFATLVTVGRDGHPQARVVDPHVPDDATIWIATNPRSRKVGEIRRDSRVTLLFFNAAANEYVTVIGRARPVTDPRTKAARWKPEWEPFYKNRHEGPDFMLIEVRPARFEASSARHGLVNDPDTWTPAIIEVPAPPKNATSGGK